MTDDVAEGAEMWLGIRNVDPFDIVGVAVIPGNPVPKSRPRFSKQGHAFTDDKDRAAESETGWWLFRSFPHPLPGNVALAAIFYRDSLRRVDGDNLLKHLLDAADGILWANDAQCTGLSVSVELDRENPRTVVAVGRHQSTLLRGTAA